MSDHVWIVENVASYLAGGLEPAECERFEQHVAGCSACAETLAAERAVDERLATLFSSMQPSPGLEDHMIQALRGKSSARLPPLPRPARLAIGAVAALLVLGLVGTVAGEFIESSDGRFSAIARIAGSAGNSPIPKYMQAGADAPQRDGIELADNSGSMGEVQLSAKGQSVALARDANGLAVSLRDQFVAGLDAPVAENKLKALGMVPPTKPPVSSPAGRAGEQYKDLGAYRLESAQVPGGYALAIAPPDQSKAGGAEQKQGPELYYSYLGDGSAPALGWGAGKLGGGMGGGGGVLFGVPGGSPGQPPAPPGASAPSASTPKVPRMRGASMEFKPPSRPAAEKPSESTSDSAPGVATNTGQGQEESNKTANGQRPPNDPTPARATGRKIIRSGDIEFEIQSFDVAIATVSRLVADIPGGFVATVNSEKLANGKVRGSVVVRLPPERLDNFVLDLRKELGRGGELKGLRIGSQDITKQYTDLESRLRAARAMEERLLNIIKTGKGEIKDLLQAEKELGVWRTKIEEIEGELRYYANQVALSTLTITLAEKEIQAPFGLLETERVQVGLEVEDVDKAQRELLAAVAAAKGRVTKSELKQYPGNQLNATVHFEVAPDAAGSLRDRMKQLGTVARLDIDRLQQPEGGVGRPSDGRVTRRDTIFMVSLYNLANLVPRDVININLASVDAEKAYHTILAQVEKVPGRVVTSNLDRQLNDKTQATIQCEVKTAAADGFLQAVKALGELMSLKSTENADAQTTTRSKRGFVIQLLALGRVPPRETTDLQLASRDVPAAYRSLQDAMSKAQGRLLDARLNETDKQNISAQLDFEVRRDEEAVIAPALAAAGDVYSRTTSRAAESENATDTKVRFKVKLINLTGIPPRETVTLGIEVHDVDQTAAALANFVAESKGRSVQVQLAHERSGRVTGKLLFDVPLAAAPGLVEKFKSTGVMRAQQSSRNLQVPESDLAIARLDVTLSNTELIVPSDEGIWSQVRKGLKTSFVALSWSLVVITIGLCVVLPWVIIVYVGYVVVRRVRGRTLPATP
jgi:hypothetical protein